MLSTLASPSLHDGYAIHAEESDAPEQWMGVMGAWAPFLGAQGDRLYDLSGSGRHGTLTNFTVSTAWQGSPLGGHQLQLDGTNDYVDFPSPAWFTLDVAQPYTWAFWLTRPTFSEWGTVWCQMLDTSNFFIIYAHTTTSDLWGPVTAGVSAAWYLNSTQDMVRIHSTSNVLTANQWHRLIVTYNPALAQASRLAIYVDGRDVTDTGDIESVGTIASITPTTGNVNLGRDGSYGDMYSGGIAEALWANQLWRTSTIAQDAHDAFAMYRLRRRMWAVAAAAPPPTGPHVGSLMLTGAGR